MDSSQRGCCGGDGARQARSGASQCCASQCCVAQRVWQARGGKPSAVVTLTAMHSHILKPSIRAESTRRRELVGRINYAREGASEALGAHASELLSSGALGG